MIVTDCAVVPAEIESSLLKPAHRGSSVGRTFTLLRIFVPVLTDFIRFALSHIRSQNALVAENLFLRKQLAFYQERTRKVHRTNGATRLTMALLSSSTGSPLSSSSRPETLIRRHRKAVQLYWRWKSRPGRPRAGSSFCGSQPIPIVAIEAISSYFEGL